MEDTPNLFESLLERVTDFGKTSYELARLKTIEKTADIVSSFIPHSISFVLFASFMLFFNLGLAFWLGEILDRLFYGFLLVASFYGFIGFVLHFFLHNWLKKVINNNFIKLLLK